MRVNLSKYEKRNFNAGKFETGDVAEKIVGIRTNKNEETECNVQWKMRPESQIVPSNTRIRIDIIREQIPDLLIDFFESIIR